MQEMELFASNNTSRYGWRVEIWVPISVIKLSERSTFTRRDPNAVCPDDHAEDGSHNGGENSKHEVIEFFFAFSSINVGNDDKQERSSTLLLEILRYIK